MDNSQLSVSWQISEIPPEDHEAIVAFHRDRRTATDIPIMPDYAYANIAHGLYENTWREHFHQDKNNPYRTGAYKAHIDGKIIGFVRFGTITFPKKEEFKIYGLTDWGELLQLYVHPDYHHLGLGWALFRRATQQLAVWGVRQMLLNVYEKNYPTRRFYERCGMILSHEKNRRVVRNNITFDVPCAYYILPDVQDYVKNLKP